jgi:hypothetical protein
MKKIVRCLIVMTFVLSASFAEAQVIGKESLVMKKNIFIGFKGGVSAMDMRYKNESNSFVNHTALYQGFANITGCLGGGVFVERTLPGWSYGLELNFNMVNAISKPDKPNFATQDSAYFANIRIPVKLKFAEESLISPYIFVAPEVGTYISDTAIHLTSHSIINGDAIQWGSKNARSLNMNIVAGLGVEGKIQIGLYEVRARFEAGYRLGLLNTMAKEVGIDRKMRGWEANIGVAFPLFLNPSYRWLN